MIKKIFVTTIISVLMTTAFILHAGSAYAGNIDIGAHAGYGVIKFEEQEDYLGADFDSEADLQAVLVGVTGEYTFNTYENLYVGVDAEWTFGLKDEESWDRNNLKVQTNDLKIFVQSYGLMFGYKNSLDNLRYRLYLSGGWDGVRFKRDNVVWLGTPLSGSTEDIRLWRIGGGTRIGYELGSWDLEGSADFSFYVDGETEDDSLPGPEIGTDGTYWHVGFQISREIVTNVSAHAGVHYSMQHLYGDNSFPDISFETDMEILAGIVKVAYTF